MSLPSTTSLARYGGPKLHLEFNNDTECLYVIIGNDSMCVDDNQMWIIKEVYFVSVLLIVTSVQSVSQFGRSFRMKDTILTFPPCAFIMDYPDPCIPNLESEIWSEFRHEELPDWLFGHIVEYIEQPTEN